MMLNKPKRALPLTLLAISALFTIILAACSNPSQPSTPTTSAPAITIPDVALTHSPVGSADITWDAQSHALKIKVTATGLAPNSTHPEHIHSGTCASVPMGDIVYTLSPLVANSVGAATSETTINNVPSALPTQGLYLNIHNGPTLDTPAEANAIACGNIGAPDLSTATIHVDLQGSIDPDGSVHGNTKFQVTQDSLVVTMTLSGLVPNSEHISHIHAGTCASQGDIVYMLQTIKADAQGNATTTTTIKNPDLNKLTTTPMYVNVHEAGTMDGMSKQQGFDPITCGNMTVNK